MNIQTENNQQDGGNYYLPCGSPFQNMRPMTPIDDMLFRTFCELGDYKLGEIQYMIQNLLFERERQRQQQQQIYDANRADCHDKVDFQSIVIEEVKVQIKKECANGTVIERKTYWDSNGHLTIDTQGIPITMNIIMMMGKMMIMMKQNQKIQPLLYMKYE